MFFFFSKLLLFLIQPINWVIGCLIGAVVTGRQRRRKRLVWAALVLTVLFTNHFLVNLVYRAWEPAPVAIGSIERPYDVGILLGGYSYAHVDTPRDRHHFNPAAARLTQAVELYKTGKIKQLLLSGGSGQLLGEAYSEAEEVVRLLARLGVPHEAILVDGDSRNTRENATYSAALLAARPDSTRYLLITSAFHMPRAAACFRAVGLSFDTFPVHHIGERVRFAPGSLLLPDRLGFFRWEYLIKEWVGYVAYRLRGYV